MINFDDYANDNKTEHDLKQPCIPDHPNRKLIIEGLGSGKRCIIDRIYLYAKDPYEAK